jgi:hypothetical protein
MLKRPTTLGLQDWILLAANHFSLRSSLLPLLVLTTDRPRLCRRSPHLPLRSLQLPSNSLPNLSRRCPRQPLSSRLVGPKLEELLMRRPISVKRASRLCIRTAGHALSPPHDPAARALHRAQVFNHQMSIPKEMSPFPNKNHLLPQPSNVLCPQISLPARV